MMNEREGEESLNSTMNGSESGRLSPSPPNPRKNDSEEVARLKQRLASEAVQKDSIAAEMQRLKHLLTDVEAREKAEATQQRRQYEMLEAQLHEAQREAKEANKQLREISEQTADLERHLTVEQEKCRALEQEHQRVMIEQHDQATSNAEIEEAQMRLKQMEAENRSLAKQLEEKAKQADFARESQREAARNAIEIQEKLDASQDKLKAEKERRETLTTECQQLRNELNDAKKEAANNSEPLIASSAPDSVPRLSLQTYSPVCVDRQRSESVGVTYVHFGPEETPRPGYSSRYMPQDNDDEEGAMEMQNIPTSQQNFGAHRRSHSLDSLASDAVPLTEAPDGNRTGDPDKPERPPEEEKKKQACPCVIC